MDSDPPTLSSPHTSVPGSGSLLIGALFAILTIPATALLHEVGHILGLVITGYHGPAVLGVVDGDPAKGVPIHLPVALYWAAGPVASVIVGVLVILVCAKIQGASRHPVLFGTLWGFGISSASMRLVFFPILLLPGHSGSDENSLAAAIGVPTLWVSAPIFLLSLATTIGLYHRVALRGFKWRWLLYTLPLWYFAGIAAWEGFARGSSEAAPPVGAI